MVAILLDYDFSSPSNMAHGLFGRWGLNPRLAPLCLPLYISPVDPPLGVPHLLHGNPNETLDRLHPIMAHPLVSTNVTVETP